MSVSNRDDFRGANITINELSEEYLKSVWCIQNFDTVHKFELLITGSACYVDINREGSSNIRLRFFIEKAEVESNGDRFASLCCSVVSGGEGERVTFSLRVVDLNEQLCIKNRQHRLFVDFDRIVYIRSHSERRRMVLEPKFLRYAASYPIWNSTERRTDMVTAGNIFRFGITVGCLRFTPVNPYPATTTMANDSMGIL